MIFSDRTKQIIKASGVVLTVLIVLAAGAIAFAYFRQDKLVSELIGQLNHDFKGRIEIEGSHISPFKNFPYISVDLEEVQIYENKSASSEILLHVSDAYVGFDLWDMMNGNYLIKRIRCDQGFLSLVQHRDGSFNIVNALSSDAEEEDTTAFHLDLRAIELVNIDLLKFNEENGVLVEAFIEHAESSFRSADDQLNISLDSRFLFNLIMENDTSFLHDKHVELNTDLIYHMSHNQLIINDSELLIEKALFKMAGSVDVENDLDLDLSFTGHKPNFGPAGPERRFA